MVSNKPGAFALTRAQAAGIETAVLEKMESAERYGAALQELLAAHGIDLIVLAGFMLILHENFVRAYAMAASSTCTQASSPRSAGAGYYGLKVHEAALAHGVKVTGATVHLVNEIPDGGKILAQKAVKVKKSDTPANPAKARDGEGRVGTAAKGS